MPERNLTSRIASWFGLQPGHASAARVRPGPPSELVRGQLVGEYAIERKLGEGGFGGVYAAVHPVIGKKAAVKVLHPQYSANPEVSSRFVAEARAANQIRHRNIIDIFSFGVLPDGRHYYVMELLEGIVLDAWLDRAGRLEPCEAFPLLQSIARALDAAHAAGIAHRDLKPENVFLEVAEDGVVAPKLLDFGVAKLLDSHRTRQGPKTQTGSPIGSPRYMSPEQCQGAEVDHRADVYAFGVLAHRMLTGALPFDAPTALELMMMHVGAEPPPMSTVCPGLPPGLDAPVLRMLEKSPDRRPASVSEAFDAMVSAAENAGLDAPSWLAGGWTATDALRAAIADQRGSPEDRPAPSLRDPAMPASTSSDVDLRSRRTRSALIAAAVMLAAAGVGIGVWQRSPHGQAAPAVSGALSARPSALRPPEPASSAAVPSADRVAVTIDASPPDAEVYLGTERIGLASAPVALPRSERPLELTLKAAGYASTTISLRPAPGLVIKAVLKPAPRGPAPMPRDLEYPY